MRRNNNFNHYIPHFIHVADRYCDKNWFVPITSRDFHNFLLIISGEGMAYSHSKEYKLMPGMLIYHAPGEVYGYTTSKTNLMHCFGINFQILDTQFSDGNWVTNTIDQLPFNTLSTLPNIGILNKYFKDLCTVWEESINNNILKCRSIFLNILYELYDQLLMHEDGIQITSRINDVILHMRKNYSQKMTLDYLASLVDLNPKYFGSLFKKQTGYTPIEYMNKVKIEKAEELIGIGYTITETSQLVGFNDPFYFSKVFKKVKGVSPRDYAKTPLHFF